jgi:hypothetical protein
MIALAQTRVVDTLAASGRSRVAQLLLRHGFDPLEQTPLPQSRASSTILACLGVAECALEVTRVLFQ